MANKLTNTKSKILYPAVKAYFPKEDRSEILKEIDIILKTGDMINGRWVAEFEQLNAKMSGTKFAVAVNSGGTALEIVMIALGIAGKEVIVPTQTFVASPNSIVRAGGIPVFGDISEKTLGLSTHGIKSLISPKTAGVMLVHMFGIMSSEIEDIVKLCRERNIFIVEDSAHAHGAYYKEYKAGGLGVAGCFSYYVSKILTTGEGGVITTNDEQLYTTLLSLRNHGKAKSGPEYDVVSNNFRLAEIPALLGVYQFKRLNKILNHRRRIAKIYRECLRNEELLTPIDPVPWDGHSYWRYPVLLNKKINRVLLQERMKEESGTRITWMYDPLCHQQPVYRNQNRKIKSIPVAEDIISRLIVLPDHMDVDEDGAKFIAHNLVKIVKEKGN